MKCRVAWAYTLFLRRFGAGAGSGSGLSGHWILGAFGMRIMGLGDCGDMGGDGRSWFSGGWGWMTWMVGQPSVTGTAAG